MKIKTAELTGAALDLAVAKCEYGNDVEYIYAHTATRNAYSSDWSQGGPIIEREMLGVDTLLDTSCALIKWACRDWKGDGRDYYGPTPLIAACRCFVASRLGDEVEVPDELKA